MPYICCQFPILLRVGETLGLSFKSGKFKVHIIAFNLLLIWIFFVKSQRIRTKCKLLHWRLTRLPCPHRPSNESYVWKGKIQDFHYIEKIREKSENIKELAGSLELKHQTSMLQKKFRWLRPASKHQESLQGPWHLTCFDFKKVCTIFTN